MVSTRSGRVTAETTSFGRVTRSRTRRDGGIFQEEIAADIGQPEVTSPAPVHFTSNLAKASPAPFGGFGSPLVTHNPTATPIEQNILGTPFQERVVKTVGKSASKAPSGRTPSAASPDTATTPLAKEVKNVAAIPLPDDAGGTQPYASEEGEPVVSESERKQQEHYQAGTKAARRSPNLLGWFALSSILVTISFAMLLSPCLDPVLYAAVHSRGYERVCRSVVIVRKNAADRVERLSWIAAERINTLGQDLPPAVLVALDQALASVKQAHVAAWSVASPLVDKVKQHVEPHWERARPKLHHAYRELASGAAPYLRKAMERINPSHGPVTSSITCITAPDFLATLEQQIVPRLQVMELWGKASQEIASKQKAAAWLLTCQAEDDCSAAADALTAAAASVANVDGALFGQPGSAGELQSELVKYLRAYSDGLVLVRRPERLHPHSVAVFVNALSEGGHLQMDGRPVTTHRALYLFLARYPPGMDAWNFESEAAAKAWLSQSVSKLGTNAGQTSGIMASFSRRIDAVLPVRKWSRATSASASTLMEKASELGVA